MELIMKMGKNEIKELFSKNWLTHDAMWYGSCVQEIGPDKANQLNKGAVRMMAGIEIKRILKLMGKPKGYIIRNFDDLVEIIETAFHVVQTSFMKFDFSFPEKNLLRGQFSYCFAKAYLETDLDKNVRFYEKFGFKLIHEAEILDVKNRFMLRKEHKSKD